MSKFRVFKIIETYKSVSDLKKYKNLGMGMSMTHSKFKENLNDVTDYTVNHLPNIDNLNLN